MPTKDRSTRRYMTSTTEYTKNGKCVYGGCSTSTHYRNNTDYITSANVPNWRTKISRATSATGALAVSKDSNDGDPYFYGVGTWHSGSDDYSRTVYGAPAGISWPGHLAIQEPSHEDIENTAKGIWVRKVEAYRNNVLAGVTLGEARRTRQMIASRARNMNSMMFGYLDQTIVLRRKYGIKRGRRLSKKRIRSYLEEQNKLYLEHTFGWTPLIADTENWYAEYDRSPFRGLREGSTIYAIGKQQNRVSATRALNISVGLAPLDCEVETSREIKTKYLGMVLTEVSLPSARLGGVGLRPYQFAPTLWELFPWSWAVDYFSNVGTVILALASPAARLAWSQTTEVHETVTTLSKPFFNAERFGQTEYDYVKSRYGGAIADSHQQSASLSSRRRTFAVQRASGTPVMDVDFSFRPLPGAQEGFNILSALAGKYKAFRKLL